jgi:hypothetical protein
LGDSLTGLKVNCIVRDHILEHGTQLSLQISFFCMESGMSIIVENTTPGLRIGTTCFHSFEKKHSFKQESNMYVNKSVDLRGMLLRSIMLHNRWEKKYIFNTFTGGYERFVLNTDAVCILFSNKDKN